MNKQSDKQSNNKQTINILVGISFIIGIFLCMVSLTACTNTTINPNTNNTKLTYVVSPCNQEDKETFTDVKITESNVVFHQKISYVCCANITLSYELVDGVLKIYEDNIGQMCKCICNYEISGAINEPYVKKVEIYGIKYQEVQPYVLIEEKNSSLIDKDVCNTDDDCICGGTDKADGTCFIGNTKYYETNVDKIKICPDFCTGIAGNFVTQCVEGTCKNVNKNLDQTKYCTQDSDCVRQPSCCDCNFGNYVNKKYYKAANCTYVCACMSRPSIGKCISNQCEGVAA